MSQLHFHFVPTTCRKPRTKRVRFADDVVARDDLKRIAAGRLVRPTEELCTGS
ncbi:hypothetical protein LINGRAHAP2_LOCUS5130 [Linum grandiflorum]